MKQRLATILQLGFPTMLAMLSQSMINLVDTALVGPLGDNALAAVGAGSEAFVSIKTALRPLVCISSGIV